MLHDSGGVWCCKPFLHSQIGFLPGAVFFLNDESIKIRSMRMRKVRITTGLSCLMAFILCFVIFGSNLAMSYDTVVNGMLGVQTSKVINDESVEDEDTIYYKSAYGDINAKTLKVLKEDTYTEAVQEQEEGTVLLYNKDNALPLSKDEQISLFGHAVVQPLYRNQSAGSRAYSTKTGVDLYKALGTLKFKVNPKLYNAYRQSKTERKTGAGTFFAKNADPSALWSLGEEPISFYTDDVKSSWATGFNDVAIVMLAREGGEGVELYTQTPTEGISQLALSQDEKDLLAMIRDSGSFKKTIVLLNTGNPMEVNWVEEYDVDAVLWIGCPGEKGFIGVANILIGNANPSGKLVDTYAVSSLSAPAVVNNTFNNQQWANLTEALQKSSSNASEISYYTVQTEGIYIGYKYYETRYEDQVLGRFNATGSAGSIDGGAWDYAKEVSYPFGYGLSYTTFDQKLDSVTVEDKTVTVTVTVTNTGSVPGKSVVQVYAQTPYGEYEQKNKIEKSSIQLLDYGKTTLLQPGASETLTIVCDKYLLASYDYTNAKGYILSEGDYYIAIGDDAHDALNNVLAAKGATGMVDVQGNPTEGTAAKAFHFTGSFDDETYRYSATGARVTNQFEDADVNYWYPDLVTYLSRSDWQGTYPVQPVAGLTLNDEMIRILDGKIYEKPDNAPAVDSIPQGDQQGIMLITMKGLDYNDDLWETFISQMTIEEMAALIANNFGTEAVDSVGKPATPAGDGPDGIGGYTDNYSAELGKGLKTTSYPNESLLTAAFNKELLDKRGALLGEEGLFMGLVEIWGPGCNLHRTPFGGRSFEYFSEDANLNYLAASHIVSAIEEKGVHAGPKHLTGNDQENNRQGVVNFFNEQAFREGALRGLEGGVVNGRAHSLMQAFNRLGFTGCSLSKALNTDVVRGEWGYVGHIETDAIGAVTTGYKTAFEAMMAAGTDSFCLDTQHQSSAAIVQAIRSNNDGFMLQQLRRAAKNILYNDANSSMMNGIGNNTRIVKIIPWWQPALRSVTIGVSVVTGLAVLAMLAAKLAYYKKQKGAEKK